MLPPCGDSTLLHQKTFDTAVDTWLRALLLGENNFGDLISELGELRLQGADLLNGLVAGHRRPLGVPGTLVQGGQRPSAACEASLWSRLVGSEHESRWEPRTTPVE